MIGTRVKAPLAFLDEIAPLDTFDGALSWSKHTSDPRPSLSAKHFLLRLLWKDCGRHPVCTVDEGNDPGGGSISTSNFSNNIHVRPHIYLMPTINARSS